MCRWTLQDRWAPPEHPRDTSHAFSASCCRLPIRPVGHQTLWGAHAHTSHPLHTLCTPFAHPNPAISARWGPIIGALSGPVGLEAIFRISGFWPRRFVGLGSLDPNTFGYPSGTPLLPFSIAIGLISSRLDRRVFRSAASRLGS